jgi:hypothetical protein
MKYDSAGNVLWTKVLGGSEPDQGKSIKETSDGKFVLVGLSESFYPYISDMILSKLDSSGNVEFTKTIGETIDDDYGSDIAINGDGSYIVAGAIDKYLLLSKIYASGNINGCSKVNEVYPTESLCTLDVVSLPSSIVQTYTPIATNIFKPNQDLYFEQYYTC